MPERATRSRTLSGRSFRDGRLSGGPVEPAAAFSGSGLIEGADQVLVSVRVGERVPESPVTSDAPSVAYNTPTMNPTPMPMRITAEKIGKYGAYRLTLSSWC